MSVKKDPENPKDSTLLFFRAELRASFSGTPVPTCRWFYNGSELIDGEHRILQGSFVTSMLLGLAGYTITSTESSSALSITSVEKKHFGEYLCTIRNQNGEELANAMILSEGELLILDVCVYFNVLVLSSIIMCSFVVVPVYVHVVSVT